MANLTRHVVVVCSFTDQYTASCPEVLKRVICHLRPSHAVLYTPTFIASDSMSVYEITALQITFIKCLNLVITQKHAVFTVTFYTTRCYSVTMKIFIAGDNCFYADSKIK